MQKGPHSNFSLIPSRNVGMSPQDFLALSFDPFATLALLTGSPKLRKLNQVIFWSYPYKVEVMVTSFIEMLELSIFGHMTTSTV